MSMLTGLIPATSGYALIYDKDIRTDINDIRNIMGFCPQHNVLFNLLTVEEHLWFYGQLKQMNDKSIKTLIENMLRDTGLTKKRNNLVSTLSGGMQRKLSVAIAFVGDANLVIAALRIRHSFSRSYGVILPSSLERVISRPLVYSTYPPVSVMVQAFFIYDSASFSWNWRLVWQLPQIQPSPQQCSSFHSQVLPHTSAILL